MKILYLITILSFIISLNIQWPYSFTAWTAGLFALLIVNEIRNSKISN